VEGGNQSITGAVRSESKSPVSHTRTVDTIINVERVGTVLASTKGAVSTIVTSITFASKSDVFIPQLIDVAVVMLGNFLDGVAHTMAGTVTRAGSSLTSRSFISFKAFASSRSAVADTLVGAFHVIMGSVGKLVTSGVDHVGELFGGTVWVDLTVHHHSSAGACQSSRGGIQISLRGIHMGKTELANTLRAVIGHPVAVAHAHVVVAAHSMRAAGIGALSAGETEDAGSEEHRGPDLGEHTVI
jgi:hypothetical protein